ncbi:MAG: hypothetical protein GXP62_06310 [Oligoflexia bacterium]|nr:hypothetical protein [Oligoflexia bacterium]
MKLGLLACLWAFPALLASGSALAASARDGLACLERVDLACAEDARDQAVARAPRDAETEELNALTLFHEGRYDQAAAIVVELRENGGLPDSLKKAPIEATAAAAAGFVEADGDGVRVRYAPGVDLVLRDEAIHALEASRRVVDGLLGGGPSRDILLDIFPDGRRFIAASGLSSDAVQTTGVIALSKWNRLLLTSPHALARGYAWKDTIAHEYIHLVVAWRTQDHCPVWLQEGLAKYLEGYWRGDRTGTLGAHQQSLLAHALRDDSFVPFKKFQYSMAYLDSGEEAALAFAQVSTMVHFLVQKQGVAVLPGLLDAVGDGQTAQQAVANAAGFDDFDQFTAAWRTWVAALPLVQDTLAALPVLLDKPGGDFADDPLLAARPDLARFARIGDLLREAGRNQAALIEYDKASDPEGPASPLLLVRRAVCYQALDKLDLALSSAQQATNMYPEFTLAQTTLARVHEARGETRPAMAAWVAAHDLNPFDPAVEAALVRGYTALGDARQAAVHRRYGRILATGGAIDPDSQADSDIPPPADVVPGQGKP